MHVLMAYNCIVAILVPLLIGLSTGSVCVGNCPPNCNSYIPNGRHTGCLGGHMCSYECDQGYKKTAGMLTCQEGMLKPFDPWGLQNEPLCKPKPCPEVIPNGALSNSCTAKVGFNCEYTCNEGYSKLPGITTIKCTSTTKWSPNPHSLCTNYNQCSYEIPGADLNLSCRRHPGEQCRYTCREGYVQSHYATADCRSTLDWMQRIDSLCIQIKCPLFLEHGTIEYPCTRKYGEICQSYRCNYPYIKPPFPPSLKCNASRKLSHRDTTGYWEWDKDMGQACIREEDLCPSTFLNGHISSDCHLQPGSECSYTCDAGCDKEPTVSKVHCRQSGGRWNEITDSLCTNCRRCPDRIANGRIVSSLCERRPHRNCSFTCNYGCRKAVTTLYCNDYGEWSNPSPCICSDKSTTAGTEESGSSSSVTIVVVVVMVVFILLILGGVCLSRHRRRMNRPATSVHENRVPMIAPSAPPLDERSHASSYIPSPYSQIQTTPAYDDTNSPPPSYEQVTADPTRFKT